MSELIGSPPAYAFVLRLEYRPEDDGRAASWAQRLATLETRYLRGRSFVAYTEHTGPEENIYVLSPLQSPPTTEKRDEVLTDTRSPETFQTLHASPSNSRSFIATFIPELSHPPSRKQPEPAPYVYLISATLKAGVTEEDKSAAREAGRKIVAAHRQHPRGRRFVTYHSYSGAEDVFYVVVPLDKLDEMDNRLDPRTLPREAYGADEAAKLLETINQVIVGHASHVGEYHSLTAG